jgi:hypothetical protein
MGRHDVCMYPIMISSQAVMQPSGLPGTTSSDRTSLSDTLSAQHSPKETDVYVKDGIGGSKC